MNQIKRYVFSGLAVGGVFLMTRLGFANELPPVPLDDFVQSLLKFMGEIKGATTMAIIAGVVQLLMLFFRTSLSNFAGKWKLLIVSGLTVAATVVGLMSQGMTLLAALVNGATLAAVQVFVHQLWKQINESKAQAVKK